MITLDADLYARAMRFGADLVAHYAAGGSPQSGMYSRDGIESSPVKLGRAKAAECIFCLSEGLSPLVLKWTVDVPDGDLDCRLNEVRVDIKSTSFNGRFLIWPISKNPIF